MKKPSHLLQSMLAMIAIEVHSVASLSPPSFLFLLWGQSQSGLVLSNTS